MAQNRKSLRETMAARPEHTGKEPVERIDEATREAIARESAERYRRFVAKLNKTSDREIERALHRA